MDETLNELLHTDIVLKKKDIMLASLKCFAMERNWPFTTSSQISEFQGTIFKVNRK